MTASVSLLLAVASVTPVEAPLPEDVVARRRLAGWEGVYATPREVGGFTGTVLAIDLEDRLGGSPGLDYRMTFYTDVASGDEIREPEKHGECLADGDALYLPTAYGWRERGGEVRLSAYVTRYTRIEINGRTVLMRDDALREFRRGNALYDYGLLIKVADRAPWTLDLGEVEHPSLKDLDADPSKPWRDPFVHGPNAR